MAEEFSDVRKSFYEARGNSACDALLARGIEAKYFYSAVAMIEEVLLTIPAGAKVGAGGSVTLRETGLLDALAERGPKPVVHEPTMEQAESMAVRKEAIVCPYYLCSSNAITMGGELINTDGIGNRVCGMIFGPDTVIVVAGINKVVEDRDEAFSRVRNIAGPANAGRLGLNTPCVKTGYCVDCKGAENICRVTTIISGRPMWTDLRVFIVGENLGL